MKLKASKHCAHGNKYCTKCGDCGRTFEKRGEYTIHTIFPATKPLPEHPLR